MFHSFRLHKHVKLEEEKIKNQEITQREFLMTDSQFKMNEIFHCSNFNNLLLKHKLQTFHLQYTCILQLISSLITLTCITVFLNYINNVFD